MAGLLVAVILILPDRTGESARLPRPPTEAAAPAGLRLGCEHSASPALAAVVPGRDLVVGALVLVGYRINANEAPPRSRWGKPDGAYAWKLPLAVRAGGRVTVAIPKRLRGQAALAFRAERRATSRLRDGDGAVRFEACPRSGGTAYTGWPGRVLATRPVCLPLEVRAAGGPPKVARVSLGAGRCAVTPTGAVHGAPRPASKPAATVPPGGGSSPRSSRSVTPRSVSLP